MMINKNQNILYSINKYLINLFSLTIHFIFIKYILVIVFNKYDLQLS